MELFLLVVAGGLVLGAIYLYVLKRNLRPKTLDQIDRDRRRDS